MRMVFRNVMAAMALCLPLVSAAAFPQDGLFFQGLTCPADGFDPGGSQTVTLSFPTLCLGDTCCELANPINVRDMEQIFLYDGSCERGDAEFSARLLVGEAAIDGMIVVFDRTAHTYARCEP